MGIFNERFKELKDSKDIMLKDLAFDLDTTSPKLSNYLNGNAEPSYEFLIKIAKYFRVSTDYLTGMSDYKTYDEEMLAKNIQENSESLNDISDENKQLIDYNSIMLHKSLVKLSSLINSDDELKSVWKIISTWNEGLNKYVLFIESLQNDMFDLEEGRKAMNKFAESRFITNQIISGLLDSILKEENVSEDIKKQIITKTSYSIKPIKRNEEEASIENKPTDN